MDSLPVILLLLIELTLELLFSHVPRGLLLVQLRDKIVSSLKLLDALHGQNLLVLELGDSALDLDLLILVDLVDG